MNDCRKYKLATRLGMKHMTLNKHSLALTLMLTGGAVMPLISFADMPSLPNPTTTVASSNNSAVEEIGKTNTVIITKPVIVKRQSVVELISEYISRPKAMNYLAQGNYKLVASYAVVGKEAINIEKLPTTTYFYLNRDTHRIGAAVNKDAAKAISYSSENVYSAKEGDTLKETLTRWAHKAGYQLEWLSEYDYPLKYSYEFLGQLADKFGPLNQVLTSISGSNYALKATITENNVILIKDNEYSPSILSR